MARVIEARETDLRKAQRELKAIEASALRGQRSVKNGVGAPTTIIKRNPLRGPTADVCPTEYLHVPCIDDMQNKFDAKCMEAIEWVERRPVTVEEYNKHGEFKGFKDRFVFFWKDLPLVHLIRKFNAVTRVIELRMEVTPNL